MRFRQFLESRSTGNYSFRELPAKTVIAWCEDQAPQYLKRAADTTIFRGTEAPLCSVKDSNDFHRVSANTANYYTLWMDNHPTWKGFPKRASSFICSTEYHTASNFGEVCVVIPADKNKVGVCADSDLWSSFADRNLSADDVMESLTTAFIQLELMPDTTSVQQDYNRLVEALSDVTPKRLSRVAEKLKKSAASRERWQGDRLEHLVELIETYGVKDAYGLMLAYASPEKFELQQAGQLDVRGNREVWVQGPCAFINLEKLDAADKGGEDSELLLEFMRRHGLKRVED